MLVLEIFAYISVGLICLGWLLALTKDILLELRKNNEKSNTTARSE